MKIGGIITVKREENKTNFIFHVKMLHKKYF